MNIDSGIVLPEGNRVAVTSRGVWLYSDDHAPICVSSRGRDMRFLTAGLFGAYFAYWSGEDESFRLIDRAGEWLWSAWMNTDKCTPWAVQFSRSGDALVCAYDFEGVPGAFFCDISSGRAMQLGCAGSPIGWNADLTRFVINGFDRYEYDAMPFFRRDSSGLPVKLLQEEIRAILHDAPLVVDRDRCLVHTQPPPLHSWDGLAILDNGGYVALKDGNVSWFDTASGAVTATVSDVIPEKERSEWWRCTLTVYGDLALVQGGNRSVVVGQSGVIWLGTDQSCTMLRDGYILAVFRDGTMEVVRPDGAGQVRVWQPPRDHSLLAADIIDGVLIAAYVSPYGNLRIFPFRLGE
jgi:hypothetical protein